MKMVIEILALFGLICCLFILEADSAFLSLLIAYVICEIILEIIGIKPKKAFKYLYGTCFFITTTVITIISNGFHLSSLFPVFFIGILLVVSHQTFLIEPDKEHR